MNRAEHPTVRQFYENASTRPAAPSILDAAWLRQLCLDCGADDASYITGVELNIDGGMGQL